MQWASTHIAMISLLGFNLNADVSIWFPGLSSINELFLYREFTQKYFFPIKLLSLTTSMYYDNLQELSPTLCLSLFFHMPLETFCLIPDPCLFVEMNSRSPTCLEVYCDFSHSPPLIFLRSNITQLFTSWNMANTENHLFIKSCKVLIEVIAQKGRGTFCISTATQSLLTGRGGVCQRKQNIFDHN